MSSQDKAVGHTPLEVHVCNGDLVCIGEADNGRPIADMVLTDDTESAEYAAFICQAVNSHDDLVEALEQIVNEMQAASSRDGKVGADWLDRRIAIGRAALAKAKGE